MAKTETFDCLSKACAGEPMFTLLAHDPAIEATVEAWMAARKAAIAEGVIADNLHERDHIAGARDFLRQVEDWRAAQRRKPAGEPGTAAEMDKAGRMVAVAIQSLAGAILDLSTLTVTGVNKNSVHRIDGPIHCLQGALERLHAIGKTVGWAK
jgi:hypothetical protein